MVEVFKTNVAHGEDAKNIVDQIHQSFSEYQANFDLEDCDLILRIQCVNGVVCPHSIIKLLLANGFEASVLPDDFQPVATLFTRR
ncbi:hypothetical protein [Pedobacter sp. ASV12]|uniref:hypothetical protein n=1 Tax=Pedobacter sp. ASV12 TaxID=2795120 RepID=UPI0018ED5594|nr:hypothetical protein [Pedobacter sp. ASV12]